MQHLTGLIAAPFTPMNPDGSLNLEIIPGYYQLLKSNGVAGAFICGSTGEGVSLSMLEKKQVAEAWKKSAMGDKDFKIIILLASNSLQDCKELARYANDIELDAVSFTAPSYFKPATAGVLAQMCAEVAGVVPGMSFYYYHIPVLTGTSFAMYDLLQAIDGRIANFAGVKYTHEDFMDYLTCKHYQHEKYDMLWGRDENMLAALALGAKGSVGSTFNYITPLYLKLIQAFENGDLDAARQLQQKSIDLIRLLGKYGGIATGKAFMKLLGLDCGEFRLPVKNMSKAQFEQFAEDAATTGFREYCSQLPIPAVA